MAGYSFLSPVTSNHSYHKDKWTPNRRYSTSVKSNRISTPIGTNRRISKAKTRLKMSTFQYNDRENYRKMLIEHVKFPTKFVKTQNVLSEQKFCFKSLKTNNVVKTSFDSPIIPGQSSLLDVVKSNGLSAINFGQFNNYNLVNTKRRSSKVEQIQTWNLPSKSNDFKESIEKKFDLLYPSKSKEIVESNISTSIRQTQLSEKMNSIDVFRNNRQSITSKIKSLFAPLMTFNFYCKIKNFIPFPHRDYVVSEEALLPVEPELVPFTEEMQTQIYAALNSPSDRVLVSACKVTITTKDLRTLVGTSWLNDNVMEFYFNLISLRSEENSRMPKVYTFGTYSFTRLMQGHSLGRWARRIDFFSFDFILVPIHHNSHWRLLVIDNPNKCIAYYDSLGYHFPQCIDTMVKLLQDESFEKHGEKLDMNQWKILYNIPDLPQQENYYDCGVFACKYAEYIARGAELTFTQDDIPYFRNCMMYEILHKKLLT